MTEREDLLRQFLKQTGADLSSMQMIKGDASKRQYFRLRRSAQSVIVMDAPPQEGEDVVPFVRIANWLRSHGLSAPEILEADEANGFLLLEDLGDDLYARLLEKDATSEPDMYRAAADVLVRIQDAEPPELEPYDAAMMADLGSLSATWYRYGVTGDTSEGVAEALSDALYERLIDIWPSNPVLVQRDYHAENLIWLPNRKGLRKVGLLDFQSAMLGHPAYDLVSVLQDARRDVSNETVAATLRHFEEQTHDAGDFRRAYHLLGLQRNLRILGGFSRLSIRDGKPVYIDLIPRVWEHVQHNLDILSDAELTELIADILPSPNASNLEKLRLPCPAQ